MQNLKKNLITIITVVKNSAPTIEKCIKSVLAEDNKFLSCLIASRKGKLSISPTVPPTSIIKKSSFFT